MCYVLLVKRSLSSYTKKLQEYVTPKIMKLNVFRNIPKMVTTCYKLVFLKNE